MRDVLGITQAKAVFYEDIFVHKLPGSVNLHLCMFMYTMNSRASASLKLIIMLQRYRLKLPLFKS